MIRNADTQDTSFVYACLCNLEDCTLDRKVFEAGYIQQLADASLSMHVLEHEKQPCGYMSIRTLYHLHHCARIAVIEELYICRNARGNGWGRAMMDYAVRFAQAQGCVQLELSSSCARKGAHDFYKRVGMSCSHYKFTRNI